MSKTLFFLICATWALSAAVVTIKNDTKIAYFITCDELGYLIEPQKEVQLDIPEVSWLKSWWHDPSIITLFKKIGEQEGYKEVFQIRPIFKADESIVIFISDVSRKARHVSAPFNVKAVGDLESKHED